MQLDVIEKKISEEKRWDEFVDNSIGGTIFHKSWYLHIHGVEKLLLICNNDKILCGIPLFENHKNNQTSKAMIQSTKVVPYSGLIFDMQYSKQSFYRNIMDKRKLIHRVCIDLQGKYSDLCFAMSIENKDITEFIRMGFFPEVRYTIINDLSINDEQRRKKYIRQRRYYIKKAQKNGITIEYGLPTGQIDYKKLTFWTDGDKTACDMYMEIIQCAIKNSSGIPIVAYNEEGKIVGMLILVWDLKKAYTVLSFYDRAYSSLGIGTYLYDSALSYACNNLSVNNLDFEGSVLPGVEDFFLSFAGRQHMYFNMYWSKNPQNINFQEIYQYG